MESNYIKWCCDQMKQAKTGADVYRIWTIWDNHVSKDNDYLLQESIPKELK